MKEINFEELNDLYLETINKCGIHLLTSDDETLEYEIFEEFDIGVISFLYPDNLKLLFNAGFISEIKMKKSILLRNKVIDLQNHNEWNIDSLRNSKKWKKVLVLADKLKTIV